MLRPTILLFIYAMAALAFTNIWRPQDSLPNFESVELFGRMYRLDSTKIDLAKSITPGCCQPSWG